MPNIFSGALSVLIGFVLLGVVANWLVQKWQYRNWLNQQKFLGAEKRYEAMKNHADEVSMFAARRLSAASRLVYALEQSEERLEERRKIYSDAIDDWGRHINSFYYKTTLYFSWNMTKFLEDEINQKFVDVGQAIEASVRSVQSKSQASCVPKQDILGRLDALQGTLGRFNRDMLNYVLKQQASTYYGVEIGYKSSHLQYFSTWQLFKALFITRVDDFRIVLTSFQFEKPARRED